jgi:uncharacterized membrane protein YfcA
VPLQTTLLLLVAAVLITIGVTQMARSRRRNRAQRQRNQIAALLIVIGALMGFIAFVGLVAPQ